MRTRARGKRMAFYRRWRSIDNAAIMAWWICPPTPKNRKKATIARRTAKVHYGDGVPMVRGRRAWRSVSPKRPRLILARPPPASSSGWCQRYAGEVGRLVRSGNNYMWAPVECGRVAGRRAPPVAPSIRKVLKRLRANAGSGGVSPVRRPLECRDTMALEEASRVPVPGPSERRGQALQVDELAPVSVGCWIVTAERLVAPSTCSQRYRVSECWHRATLDAEHRIGRYGGAENSEAACSRCRPGCRYGGSF